MYLIQNQGKMKVGAKHVKEYQSFFKVCINTTNTPDFLQNDRQNTTLLSLGPYIL